MGKVLDRGTYTSVTEMSLLPVPRIPMTSHVSMISHCLAGEVDHAHLGSPPADSPASTRTVDEIQSAS